MTAEEMVSGEMKELRIAMTEGALCKQELANTGGTYTDLFQCNGSRTNCTCDQVQHNTNVPMTTFALSKECSNLWMFP